MRKTSCLLLINLDVWWLLVETNTEALKLVLNDFLMREGLGDVEDDADEITGTCSTNDLSTATLTVFGSLNDTREVKKLNFGTLVINHTCKRITFKLRDLVGRVCIDVCGVCVCDAWDTGECGKLVSSGF